MRLGVYGGSFDPIHWGHLLLAEQCREQCELDEVWFVPAGIPPHKESSEVTPGKARVEMVEFAIAGCPEMSVSDLELKRSGKSYTVDTLEALHAEDPARELFFLIGADSLHDLPTWRTPERLCELATVVAVNRGDDPLPDLSALAGQLSPASAARIRQVSMPGMDLSSSDIRRRVAQGRSIRFLVPRAVEAYIEQHGLYRAPGVAASAAPKQA